MKRALFYALYVLLIALFLAAYFFVSPIVLGWRLTRQLLRLGVTFWGRFWHAVAMWRYLNYPWPLAWAKARRSVWR
ncbi:hypothetical protein [Accumulibacter sp.]|uniref:hypothetical protein n=1 Tax=Accumulibacter sp. TaxID=2053492 RepID=UPI00261F2331|nr:hypothetical protein [Accumulibacter sp.]